MIESISYLNIKPIYQYRGNGKGQTTITSFDELLKDEISQATAAGSMTAQETESVDGETSQESTAVSEASETTANAVMSLYRDPKTGQAVQYIDVADEANKTSSASSSVSTTEAASMKETKYDAYFKEAAEKYGVSESLLKGIAKAESNFNPKDVSSAGAIGIMQLMPDTAKEMGVTDPYDPRQNILGGARCIAEKLKEFNGDVRLALAAYNAGSGAVKRNGGVPSYCTKYVNKVLSYKEAFETAEAVG